MATKPSATTAIWTSPGGRSGFFTRVAYPETVELLARLGSSLECLHTHFLDTGDVCAGAGVNDVWAPSPEKLK